MDTKIIDKSAIDEILCKFSIDFSKVLIDRLRGTDSQSNFVFKPIFEDDPGSPLIAPVPENQNHFMVIYPKNSTPYTFELDDMKKICYIAMGEVYEEFCGKKLRAGDVIEIPPGKEYKPYTKGSMCIAYVVIDSHSNAFNLN
ncbi:hypothetical protein [Pleomorphovibrio marinus]|uniref:hypothetical protein n=1 Tax=Pleomorphovibrio marinus TaxID=2164132 RepID=UPI000E0A2A30|nr:hypothetical protein [Pleomorphovibrio marinus]